MMGPEHHDFDMTFESDEDFDAQFVNEAETEADFGEFYERSINDYEKLVNKPQIEGVTLIGNKTFPDLGLEKLSNTELENLLNI